MSSDMELSGPWEQPQDLVCLAHSRALRRKKREGDMDGLPATGGRRPPGQRRLEIWAKERLIVLRKSTQPGQDGAHRHTHKLETGTITHTHIQLGKQSPHTHTHTQP